MVLQDLGDVPTGSGDDFSQNDQYASTSASGRRFDSTDFPKPLFLVGPFLGFSDSVIRFKTEQTIKFAEQKVHRALTHPEAQALAYHLYQLEQRKSWYAVAGVTAGGYRWYSTMAETRYPFYKPKPESVDPNKFLFIKGPFAQYARQSWRLFAYTLVAGELGKLIGQIVAQPLAARDTANDPALSQFSVDLKAALSVDSQKSRDFANDRKAEWEERVRRNAGAAAPRKPAESASTQSLDDDMSPTSGDTTWGSSSSSDFYNDSGASSFSEQQQSQKQQPAPRPQRTSSWNRPQQRRDDGDDDASPTGGLFQDEVQNQSNPGESAWERLRRGAAPATGPRGPSRRQEPPQRQQNDGPDDFTFANSDEERKVAQEKAQREFDERIERERQGKDFSDERRW